MGDRAQIFCENLGANQFSTTVGMVRCSVVAVCLASIPIAALAETSCFDVDVEVQVCPTTGKWLNSIDVKSKHLLLYTSGLEVEIWNQPPMENKTNLDRTAHAIYIASAQRDWRGMNYKQPLSDPSFPAGTEFHSTIERYREPLSMELVGVVPLKNSTLFLVARGLGNPSTDDFFHVLAPLISGLSADPVSGDGTTTSKEKTDGQ